MRKSPKEPLNVEKIVHTALVILDKYGVDRLSMRRLGAELNVEAASLYHHIPNKDTLIQKMVDTVSAQAIITIDESMSWPQALQLFATTYKNTLKMHPGIVPLVAIHPISTEVGEKLSNHLLKKMKKAKMDDEQALFLIQSVAVFVIGHTLAEVGNWPDSPTAPQSYYDDWFEIGLSALIKGFELQFDAKLDKEKN